MILLEDKIFDETKELSCTIIFPHSTDGEEKMWILRSTNYCAVGVIFAPLEFTNVVCSKFASMVCIVDNVEVLEPKLIHLDDSKIEFAIGVIPSMFSG